MAKAHKKETLRGGARKGAGRKPKFNEQTDTVSYRFPLSLVKEIKADEKANDTAYRLLKKHYGVQEQPGADGENGR